MPRNVPTTPEKEEEILAALANDSHASRVARALGDVNGAGQVARRCSEFLGLTHIDKDDDVARGEAALQFKNLDPCRRIHAWPPEQAR
jgi:hypothetical protein